MKKYYSKKLIVLALLMSASFVAAIMYSSSIDTANVKTGESKTVANVAAIENSTKVDANVDFLPFYKSAEFSPMWIKPGSDELNGFHSIPDFSFTNQDGLEITQSDFDNKITVVNFFFTTCPGICPMIKTKLAKVQSTYLADSKVSLLSHSIRPTTDTVMNLKKYALGNKIKSGKWNLVTGDKDAIYALAKNAYFANEDLGNIQNTKDFLHTENVMLIDQNRHIRGIYNGLNTASIDNLISDIRALKKEM